MVDRRRQVHLHDDDKATGDGDGCKCFQYFTSENKCFHAGDYYINLSLK